MNGQLSERIRIDFRSPASGMPKSKNFHCFPANAVNDAITLEDNFTDVRIADFRHDTPSERESFQSQSAVDEAVSESRSNLRAAPLSNVKGDRLEVSFGSRRKNYFEAVHSRRRSRSNSAVTFSPRSISAKPSLIPATNSISWAISDNEASSGSRSNKPRTISLLLMDAFYRAIFQRQGDADLALRQDSFTANHQEVANSWQWATAPPASQFFRGGKRQSALSLEKLF